MHQVDRHSQMLYEMDTKLLKLNKTLQNLMWTIDVIRYENSVLHYFQARIYHVYTSLYALCGDVDSLFEYMRVLATQELNPAIIPPGVLKTILHKIENDIKSNARLKLCEDPNTNIWSYYGTIKLTPIVLQDYLMLIMTVPLVDQTLQMNLYRVHNLPMLHPTLQLHVQYEIEGPYLATLMDSMYITLPTDIDVRLCLMTKGHLCMFNQALYPVDKTDWCIYALFINDINKIKKNCILKPLNRTTNLAYSLDGYLWAISALAAEKLQIRCVIKTHVITLHPSLQIVDIGNGCEAYSTSIYIPAKSELTATMQSLTRSQFFLDYNFQYTNVSNFVVWYKTDFATLTNEEITSLKAKIMKLPTMPMDIFDKTLETIDEDYPFSLSPKLILAILILTGVIFIVFGILFIWYKRKTTLATSTVGHLHKLIPSLKEKEPSLNSLLPIFSEFVHPTKSTNHETTIAGSQNSPPTRNEQSLPTMVPHHHRTKSNKPKMALPSANTNNLTIMEPISLKQFNRAAADLDTKGEIQLQKYQKLLSPSKIIMEAAKAFAVSGETMDFMLGRIRTGQLTPPALFIEIIVEKCQLINHHFLNTRDHLRIATNVSSTTATITIHDTLIEDSKLNTVTITNTPDLETQLVHLWLEVQQILKYYNENNRIAEMASIKTYYNSFAYNRMIAQHFIFEFF